MKTVDNLENLHFLKIINPFHREWKRNFRIRQVIHNIPERPSVFLLVDVDTMELFVYFPRYGTAKEMKIFKLLDHIGEHYIDALSSVFDFERKILKRLTTMPKPNIRKIKSDTEFLNEFKI